MQTVVTRLPKAKLSFKGTSAFMGVSDGRYTVRLARNRHEIESALRLRHRVFNLELGHHEQSDSGPGLEFDAYDFRSLHMIVIAENTGETVGTYRLNSIETARSSRGFYSFNEFTIEDLPIDVVRNGVELGRACIDDDHRNTKVLFLLLQTLLIYLSAAGKRYFFGCCSIFTQDPSAGERAFRELLLGGHFHEAFSVSPRKNEPAFSDGFEPGVGKFELPSLFNMYLRMGAKVCSPPMIDRNFGTIDFFVVFDNTAMSGKYKRLFGV